MNQVITRLVLFGSGTVLGMIGSALMVSPKAFLETSHVFVERDPGLMSELAAPGGLLIVTGALMLMGAVKVRFASLALGVGAVVYGSYAIGRVISMVLHGLPSQSLISATILEVALAIVLGGLWLRAWRKQNESEINPRLAQANI
ncbi:MAG: DUF4345 domain-containing protein [Pseudomonadota bacterium]